MQNVFHTIKAAVLAGGLSDAEGTALRRFALSLPMGELNKLWYVIERGDNDLITIFMDEHPMWRASAFSDDEIQGGLPLDTMSPEKLYRLAHTIYAIEDGTEQTKAMHLRHLYADATSGMLQFKRGTPEEAELLERAYTLATWTYIHLAPNAVEDYLWGNYYLVKGLRIGLDLRAVITGYLNRFFRHKRVRRDVIAEIVGCLEKNPTTLPAEGAKTTLSIGEWLRLARKELPLQATLNDIDAWLGKHEAASGLSDTT